MRAAWVLACVGALLVDGSTEVVDAADVLTKAPPPTAPREYDWAGFYVGGHLGYAWGSSNWDNSARCRRLARHVSRDLTSLREPGAFLRDCKPATTICYQTGLSSAPRPTRRFQAFKIPMEFPSAASRHFPPRSARRAIPRRCFLLGTSAWSHRLCTGQLAALCNRRICLDLRPANPDATGHRHDRHAVFVAIGMGRRGRRGGAGSTTLDREYPVSVQRLRPQQCVVRERRAAVRFRFVAARVARRFELSIGYDVAPANVSARTPDPDIVNFHGQTTFTWQGYPAFRSSYQGTNSLPAGGEGRETLDATLYAGVRLWKGAELWLNPEIDQGFGFGNMLRSCRIHER